MPAPWIPSQFCAVGQLPLTLSGKLDRAAVARLGRDRTPAPAAPEDVAPRAGTAAVLDQFREVLSRPGMGWHDRFTDMGGTSIQAVRLSVALRERLGRLVLPEHVVLDQSPAALAQRMLAARDEANAMKATL